MLARDLARHLVGQQHEQKGEHLAAARALALAAADQPDASAVALIAAADLKLAVAEKAFLESLSTKPFKKAFLEERDEEAFKKRLEKFLLVDLEKFLVENKIC